MKRYLEKDVFLDYDGFFKRLILIGTVMKIMKA